MTRPTRLRIQFWSWNYAPEPTAMGPIATIWARFMVERGHEVSVVTAYPHYPGPLWGRHLRPRRESRDGISVLRLPLLIGHGSTRDRIGEEVTYALSSAAALSLLPSPDVYVAVSPSFAALGPIALSARMRRRPWVLWLQDILPDAAVTTGLMQDSLSVRLASRFERRVYQEAGRIVVISETFRRNLLQKGVSISKIEVIYNPAVRGFASREPSDGAPTILAMGNIGLSQGLAEHVRAFEAGNLNARLVITGTGEAAKEVRVAVSSPRVELLGLVDDRKLDDMLASATIGLVTQRIDVEEFNVPSRLMTFMARSIPVVASCRPTSEVAYLLQRSGGGWVTTLSELVPTLEAALSDPTEITRRGQAARSFAEFQFRPESMAARFDEILGEVAAMHPR